LCSDHTGRGKVWATIVVAIRGQYDKSTPYADRCYWLTNGVVQIVAGDFHTLCFNNIRNVKCWGFILMVVWEMVQQSNAICRWMWWINEWYHPIGCRRLSYLCKAQDGRPLCWGWDTSGQLGLGKITRNLYQLMR